MTLESLVITTKKESGTAVLGRLTCVLEPGKISSFFPTLERIDGLTIISTHELCESITNPSGFSGWTLCVSSSSFSIQHLLTNDCNQEIADLCEPWWGYGQDEETGIFYAVQKIFSITTGCCVNPIWSGTIFDYSVKDAPAIASYPTYAGDALVIAWTEQVAPTQNFPVFGSFPFGRIFIMNNITNGGLDYAAPIILQDSTNPNPEFSIDSPAVSYGPNDLFYIAWTGNDPGHTLNLMSASWIDLSSWGDKLQLSEYSPYGPALAYGNGYLFIAWAGTDNRINIRRSSDGVTWNDSDKVILQQWTIDSPSLAFVNNTLYLLFRSSSSDQFFIMTSIDSGKSFSDFTTIPNQTTDYTPALTQVGNDLILVWRGTDPAHQINAMRADTSNPSTLQSFDNQIVFTDTSNGGVSLTPYLGQAYVAWGGTDPNHLLNIMPVVFQT
jgi:hypothetical protein